MTQAISANSMGRSIERLDGRAKVTGTAPYAFEHHLGGAAYLHPVQATIACGRITGIDTEAARQLDGVLAVLTHSDAEPLDRQDAELAVLQSPEVAFRGQFIGAVVAETPETARQAAALVRVDYERRPHDAELARDRTDLYTPEVVNPAFETDTSDGDPDGVAEGAAHVLDAVYTTPMEHNNPMEPHTTTGLWDGRELVLYDSTQGVHAVRSTVAGVFGLDPQQVRVIAPHVGGGFGSKGLPHANVVLAALAARALPNRPVKFALTRQQMFSVAGYRTPTDQRVLLAADEDGGLTAIRHDVVEQTSRIKEFAEQTAVPTRNMYAAPNRATSHRLAALDVPVPSWMRAPGECPGMFALETAMDEMAERCGLDPIEFRQRNEPELDPETGNPFSSRHLVDCMREGARRFGWSARDPLPRSHRRGRKLVGLGMAASSYPVFRMPGSCAEIRVEAGGRYRVDIGAVDIGTGARTALAQIAADALGTSVEHVELRLGDTVLPEASVAGGSSGVTTWGSTICEAARVLHSEHGSSPPQGSRVRGELPDNPHAGRMAMHAYGAHFVEAEVDADTGEVRVPRMLGVFAAGRIVSARAARSQFIGGMTMGLSMALHEDSVLDPRSGHVVNHDFAEYHIASHADAVDIDATWIDEQDPYVNPMGSKGIGEIGNVGSAAAIGNAVYHATGIRVRDLPIMPDKLLERG